MAKQERAIATRQQIVKGAAELFDREGYERASLSDIVDHSGLTKGALYFHFKSKDELAAVIIEEQHAISMNAVKEINRTGAPALEQIVMFCYALGDQMVHDPVVRAGIRLTLEMSAVGRPSHPYLDWMDACETMFRAAIEQGDVLDTIDAKGLARHCVSAFTGVQLVSNVLTARADLEEQIDQLLALVLAAIVPPRRRHKIERICHARWVPERA